MRNKNLQNCSRDVIVNLNKLFAWLGKLLVV